MQSWMIAGALGIGLVAYLPRLPSLSVAALLLPLFFFSYFIPKSYRVMAMMFIAGISWGLFYGYGVLAAQLPVEFEQQELIAEGVVKGLPRQMELRGRHAYQFDFYLTNQLCWVEDQSQQPCHSGVKLIRLKWITNQQIIPGQHWRLPVKLKRPHGSFNPGGFDYQSWLVQQGIGATGHVRSKASATLLGHSVYSIDYQRWQIQQYLNIQLADLSQQGILKALLIGDKAAISPSQWQLFSATGTVHLMVISGLHIGLMATFGFYLGRLLSVLSGGVLNQSNTAISGALIMALLYGAAAGFSLPTQRALLMILVFMLSLWRHRQSSSAQTWMLALLVSLLVDPLAVISVSFWLSFVAVAVIMTAVVGRYSMKQKLRQWWLPQWTVFVGLLPVLAICFGQISYLSPLCNLLMIPIFSVLIVPANFLAAILALANSSWALTVWQLLDDLLIVIERQLYWLVDQVDGVLLVATITGSVLWLAVLGACLLLLPRGVPGRYCGVILLASLLLIKGEGIAANDLKLVVLDVGQGLAVVIHGADYTVVYDLGPIYSEQFNAVDSVVLPYLRSMGIQHIDALILSHADSDHAGAWQVFVEQIDVAKIYTGEVIEHLASEKVSSCHAAEAWQQGQHRFEFLPFDNNQYKSGNDQSCVLRIAAAGQVFLLVGDIERKVELSLIEKYGDRLKSDLLIAPHHGSLTSSSWPFVRTVLPRYGIFSAGYLNQFNHPNPLIYQRYQEFGTKLYNTSSSGSLIIDVVDGTLMPVVDYRALKHRYWF